LNAAPKRPRDFKIAKVDVGTAMRALAGLRSAADLLLVAAAKATDGPDLLTRNKLRELIENGRLFKAGNLLGEQLLNAVVLPALPTKCRFRVGRLQLAEATVRAISADFLRLFRGVLAGHNGPGLAGGSRRLGCLRWAGAFRLGTVSALDRSDFGFADKGGAFLDHETGSLEIALKHCARFQFATLVHRDITMHFAQHGDGLGLYFAADLGVLAHGQDARGRNFAFHLSIDSEFVLELDGAFDFHVCGEDILTGDDFGHGIGFFEF
jgi:hypothetical protein